MSSHHIVREGQEPALIIANGESCSRLLTDQLLEWSPFVVVLDGAVNRVLDMGIKFDALLGDFDSSSPDELAGLIPPATEIVHTPDQNKTDLEKAFEFLIEREHRAVYIIWATGRRSDHYMNNIATLVRYKDLITPTMVDDYSRIYPIASGFRKHYTEGTGISLIPLNRVKNVITSNLTWNLSNEDIEFPFRTGSSNRVAGTGLVTIDFEAGDMLMMECSDL